MSYSSDYEKQERAKVRRLVGNIVLISILCVLVIAGCSTFVSAYTPVDAGTVSAVTRFGGVTGTVFHPGLNWKTPFIEGTINLPTQPRVYETSGNPDTSKADYTDYPVNAQTSDGQQITIKYSVLFHVPIDNQAIVSIASEYRTMDAIVERLIKAQSRSGARTHAQRYSAEELYGNKADRNIFDYQSEVFGVLKDKFATLGYGVVLDDFLIRKIDFDPDYVQTIEQQQIEQEKIETAQYQSQQAKFEADRVAELAKGDAAAKVTNATADAEVRIINANAEAEQVVIAAKAEAQSIELRADAEAYAKEQVGRMLDRYPETLQLEFIKQFNAVDWGIMPFDSVTPLFPLDVPGQ